jgi:uncharacterized membrane protein
MKPPKLLLILPLALPFLGCANDSESDLVDNSPNNGTVTYTGTVKSIIDNNCISCHGNPPTQSAPMSLTTYANVMDAVANKNLIGRISLNNGDPSLMPKNGLRLPQNQIDAITQWKNNNYPQ